MQICSSRLFLGRFDILIWSEILFKGFEMADHKINKVLAVRRHITVFVVSQTYHCHSHLRRWIRISPRQYVDMVRKGVAERAQGHVAFNYGGISLNSKFREILGAATGK